MLRTLGLSFIALCVLLTGCSPSAPAPIPVPVVRTPAPVTPPATASTPATASSPSTVPTTPTTPPPAGAAKEPGGDAALGALSRDELGQKMVAVQQQGFQLMQQNKAAEGYKTFQESAKYARELQKRFPDLSPQEKAGVNNALYNDACALAMGGDPKAAFTALKEAVSAGFADTNQLTSDTDLATVRALPEFEAWQKELDAMAAAHAKEEVRNEMTAFKSYPFDFTLPDLDDKPLKLADLKGKVVVVDFWGTWCPPCRAEIPSFVKLQTKYGDKGLQIVGLGYERGDKEAAVKLTRDFMEAQKMNYTCVLGDDVTQKQVPEFRGYPTTLFIDRTGKVRLQYVGLHPYATLEAAVTMLLEEPGT
ncbi:MAG: redoxin domain-containing protein [Pirellulaceae bacterium]|nr:redoxin domain-containing protein [Pirellulaceae bacterium]